jgi:CDP-diacylglycerol--serine O-phosphatidyltransferase
MVLPVFVMVVLFVALLVSYPWHVLTAGSLLFIAALPLGWLSYRGYQRKDAEAAARTATATMSADPQPATPPMPPHRASEGERPERLN